MKKYVLFSFFAFLLSGSICLAQAAGHSVTLTWTAPSSTGLTGFNVYRMAGACPSSPTLSQFTKLGSTASGTTTYTDSTVTAGTLYCFTVTSTSAGGESGLPGTLQVTIPVLTVSNTPPPPVNFGGSAQ